MQGHGISPQIYPDVLRTDDVLVSPQDDDAHRKGFNARKMGCYGGHDVCDGMMQQGYKIPRPCSDGNNGVGYPYYPHGRAYLESDDSYISSHQAACCDQSVNHLGAVCDGIQSSEGMGYAGKSSRSPASGSDTSMGRACKGASQGLNNHGQRALGPCYSSKGLSCAVLLNPSSDTKVSKNSLNSNLMKTEDFVPCCNTSPCDAIDSSCPEQDSPNLKLSLESSIAPVQRVVENFRPIIRGRQPSLPAVKQQQVSFFSDTVQVAEVYSMDHSSKYTFQIYPKVDRGFFMANNGWTCYRRNYFQVSAAFNAKDQDDSAIQLPCIVGGSPDDKCLYAVEFQLGISARVSKSDGNKHVVLVQHTPKRDRGPQIIPRPKTVCAGGDLGQYPSVDPGQLIVTFERLQFKTATANNGRRRAAQQYYALIIELLAVVKGSQSPKLIAYVESAPLVVRGRSPGHYSDSISSATSPQNQNSSAPAIQKSDHLNHYR